ncbi:MAG: lycopene cyclase family protein [Aquimonas sp.]|nr:lycopene cyclase family protein [Aquimonas sp.]
MLRHLRPHLDADLLILGGGLAGLSLASALARRGYQGRVQVLEPRTAYEDDRSWAFWARDGHLQAEEAEQHWRSWQVGVVDRSPKQCAAPGWRYCYVRSARVYAAAQRQIEASDRITLRLGCPATGLHAVGDALRVDTAEGPLFATQVVDTRPPSAERRARSGLLQVFAGRELESERDLFAADSVELMTDLRCDAQGLVFSYVLPLSPRRALVEATRFATTPLPQSVLETDLDALIAARGWTSASTLRREYAVLPMGLPDPAALPVGAVRAGVAAGGLRAASGYGFLRIRSWAERCAIAITSDGSAVGHPPEPPLRRWMDALFLQVLRREPERAPELFLRLASRVRGGAFVRFMSDCASAADCARVVAALPPAPFLRALWAGLTPPVVKGQH